VFEEPLIPIDRLSTQLQWKLDNGNAQVQVAKLRFANTDAEGDAEASWRTSDPAVSSGKGRFPGVLDLQASSPAPMAPGFTATCRCTFPKETRDYVRDAVTAGTASSVDFRVKRRPVGHALCRPEARRLPHCRQGGRRHYAYVPPTVQAWPQRQGR
jgi:uncharacterized protein YhdP